MKLEHSEKTAEPQHVSSSSAPQATRRKLIQTGLAGAPVLLALTSVPALAAECKQPSGFSASGNLSQNGTTPCSPKMNGVKFWQDYAAANPNPPNVIDDLDNKNFGDVFSSTVTDSIRKVLTVSGSPLQKKIIAAWLSAKASPSLFTEATAIRMWNEGIVSKHFVPNPSVPSIAWTASQVEQYLDYVLANP